MNSSTAGAAGLIGFVVVFAISFLIFLLLREVWCWYWKINAAVQELGWIRSELQKMNAREDRKDAANAPTAFAPTSDGYAPIR